MNCKKLKAIISEKTCIARQKAIKKQQASLAKNGTKGNGPNWGNSGGNGPIMEFVSCVGCEIGLELLRNEKPRKKTGRKMKTKTDA
ncbi:hypothetical protein C4588_06230 [Candidatus Parcubacteria bacterium]|nr:MAG: hypothetical protein C4588_06230 [Candidatus Parcubacteria bacterium]